MRLIRGQTSISVPKNNFRFSGKPRQPTPRQDQNRSHVQFPQSAHTPFVAVFLAEQDWTQQNIGFVLTAAGFAGLLTQLPAGQLLDTIRSKRIVVALGAMMVAAAALIIAL